MKRIYSMVLVLVILVMSAACSSGGNNTTTTTTSPGNASTTQPTTQPVTITWWDYQVSKASVGAFEKLMADYEATHPNVKIKRQYVPFEDFKNKMLMGSAANELPDIVALDNVDHQTFAAAGIFADITKEVQEWGQGDQYYKGPWSSTMYKGKNYGVPNSSNNLALFYNADMLKEAGITPPKTWDELKAAAKALTKNGKYGLSMSAIKTEMGTYGFLPFVWEAGSDLNNFNSDGTVRAITLWKDLINSGSMSKEVLIQDLNAIQLNFVAGNSAMMVNGTWQIPAIKSNAKFNWGVVPLPSDKQSASILGGENLAIINSSKQKAIAWDFIKFAQSPDNIKKFTQAAGRLPSRKDVIQDPYWQNDVNLKVFADSMETARARAYGPNYPKISQTIQDMIQIVLTGGMSPADAVKKANEKIQPLLQQ